MVAALLVLSAAVHRVTLEVTLSGAANILRERANKFSTIFGDSGSAAEGDSNAFCLIKSS